MTKWAPSTLDSAGSVTVEVTTDSLRETMCCGATGTATGAIFYFIINAESEWDERGGSVVGSHKFQKLVWTLFVRPFLKNVGTGFVVVGVWRYFALESSRVPAIRLMHD